MVLLNSTQCLCGKDLKEEKFDKYTPKAMNDRFYGGRVSMEGEIKCECGRELKGYFQNSFKMNSNSNYELIDLEVIKDIPAEEKIENKGTSCDENQEKLEIVEENANYNPKSYDEMDYRELQEICKEKGIKASGKRENLIETLKGLN